MIARRAFLLGTAAAIGAAALPSIPVAAEPRLMFWPLNVDPEVAAVRVWFNADEQEVLRVTGIPASELYQK